jgi:hypothetical protein
MPEPLLLLPALRLWRQRLQRDPSTKGTYDPLWRAACWEATAEEATDPEHRARCLHNAKEAMREPAA